MVEEFSFNQTFLSSFVELLLKHRESLSSNIDVKVYFMINKNGVKPRSSPKVSDSSECVIRGDTKIRRKGGEERGKRKKEPSSNLGHLL